MRSNGLIIAVVVLSAVVAYGVEGRELSPVFWILVAVGLVLLGVEALAQRRKER